MSELIDYFVKYANLGWHLVPCTKEKYPGLTGKGGWYNASNETSQWFVWREKFPDCLWGVRPVGEHIVLDADYKHGGLELIKKLQSEHGKLPLTPTAITGGGGRHYHFSLGTIKNCTARKILGCDGLELITISKGVIIPPSIHPNGKAYAWEIAPWEMPMAVLPEWLLNCTKSIDADSFNGEVTWGDDADFYNLIIPQGAWNKPVCDCIITEKLQGVSEDECLRRALAWCDANGDESYKTEIARKVHSIYRNEKFVPKGEPILSFPPSPKVDADALGTIKCEANSPLKLHADAFYGIAGEIVKAVDKETEADASGILLSLLVSFGNIIGRSPHYIVQGDEHRTNLYCGIVGETSAGKGQAWGVAKYLLSKIEPEWYANCVSKNSLSTGEGILKKCRDEVKEIDKEGNLVIVDAGAKDKRFLAYEPEYGKTLTISSRDGNSLFGNLKTLWDEGSGEILRSSNPLKVTDAHISMIAHCTPFELKKKLQSEKRTETFDGSFNRYLWCRVSNSKPTLLKDGDFTVLDKFLLPLKEAITKAKVIGRMRRSDDAETLWRDNLVQLRFAGDYTPCCDRARPQVLRLSMVYALLEGSTVIEAKHLNAALAVWNYCEASAKLIFAQDENASGESTNLEVKVLGIIEADEGIHRSEILRKLPRTTKAASLTDALVSLHKRGLAHPERCQGEGSGRIAECWFSGPGDGDNDTTLLTSTSKEAPASSEGVGQEGKNSETEATSEANEFFPSLPPESNKAEAKETEFFPSCPPESNKAEAKETEFFPSCPTPDAGEPVLSSRSKKCCNENAPANDALGTIKTLPFDPYFDGLSPDAYRDKLFNDAHANGAMPTYYVAELAAKGKTRMLEQHFAEHREWAARYADAQVKRLLEEKRRAEGDEALSEHDFINELRDM